MSEPIFQADGLEKIYTRCRDIGRRIYAVAVETR